MFYIDNKNALSPNYENRFDNIFSIRIMNPLTTNAHHYSLKKSMNEKEN